LESGYFLNTLEGEGKWEKEEEGRGKGGLFFWPLPFDSIP